MEELRGAVERKHLGGEENASDKGQVFGGSAAARDGDGGGQEGAGRNYQSGLQGKDFLSDVAPCEAEECEEPSGTLLAAGELEVKVSEPKEENEE